MILAMHERAVHIVIVNYLFRSVFFDARAAGVAEVGNFVTAALCIYNINRECIFITSNL